MFTLDQFCAFCTRIRLDDVTRVHRGSTVASFEPLNPVTPGHMLFIPMWHAEHPDPGVVGMCMQAAAEYAALGEGDYNLIISSGRSATQTIPHCHVHYVPRREHDGLRLPWTGQEWRAR